jgi:hypothetical protein
MVMIQDEVLGGAGTSAALYGTRLRRPLSYPYDLLIVLMSEISTRSV